MLVKNDGDKVTVKTKNSEKEVKQISSELVAINPNSDKINIIEDDEVMLNFMVKNNISATFSLSTENVQWPEIKHEEKNNLVAIQAAPEHKSTSQVNTKTEEKEDIVEEQVTTISEERDPLLE
jgi:hypothetical protein